MRALLYFDEIFGYFPPTAEPPSKRPLLTLLKQARAYGLGVVLATQNPVDLDYKGLTNAGTWFIGKLQAERDKQRVIQGLKGALSAAGNSTEINYDRLINGLGNRLFLMHNVHASKPVVFQTRWAHSYLRGPLTRPQLQILMKARKQAAVAPATVQATSTLPAVQIEAVNLPLPTLPVVTVPALPPSAAPAAPAGFLTSVPALDPNMDQVYLPLEIDDQSAIHHLAQEARQPIQPEQMQLVYEAAILGAATIRFIDRKRAIDEQIEQVLLAPVQNDLGGIDWADAEPLTVRTRDLQRQPERADPDQGPFFAPVPEQANSVRKLQSMRTSLADWLYSNQRLKIQTHAALGISQQPGNASVISKSGCNKPPVNSAIAKLINWKSNLPLPLSV